MKTSQTDYEITADTTPCYALTEAELAGHHPLCDLATADGHATLCAGLNANHWWNKTVAEVALELTAIPAD